MSRVVLRLLFVVIGLSWLGFTIVDLLGSTLGDCFDNQWCEGRRSIALELVFWRSLCVAILILLTYRFFRRTRDV